MEQFRTGSYSVTAPVLYGYNVTGTYMSVLSGMYHIIQVATFQTLLYGL